VSIDVRDNRGGTAFQAAAETGVEEMIRVFVEYRAGITSIETGRLWRKKNEEGGIESADTFL
jgi:hypothetical protein